MTAINFKPHIHLLDNSHRETNKLEGYPEMTCAQRQKDKINIDIFEWIKAPSAVSMKPSTQINICSAELNL